MSREHVGKLWAAVGIVLFYYFINTWIVTQGGNEIFDAKLILSKRVPAAVMGIVVCSVLLTIVSLLGFVFARGGPVWHRRIPVVGLKGLDTGSKSGGAFQVAILISFSLLPASSLVHFWRLMINAPVMDREGSRLTTVFDWVPTERTLNDPARICSDWIGGNDPCAGNATYLPGFEPLVLGVLSAIACFSMLLHFSAILGAWQTQVSASATLAGQP